MDEEIKEVGEMATIEDEEDITIEEDYTTLEAETIIIDDDSNIQTDAEYEQAVEQKELADGAREALSAVLLSVLEKGEINDDDIAEIAAQQEIYTENVTALKILGLTTESEKSTAGKSTTNVITSNIDYDELIKVLSEKADWLYIDEDGQVMLNGEVVPKLKVVELEAEKIKADVGEFKDLTTENFIAVNAKIDNLEVTDLTAVNADITNLKAQYAEINTLVNGNLTSDNIQSIVITGDKFTVANGFIKDAMIETVSANKINTGIINTNNVSIQSEDGSMIINGTTQQFKDKNNKVRIQIGKDATGNFTFALFSQDGQGILIDETGIKSGAVPNGLIVNDMVSDGANISGSKLDINSVINSINNGTTVIKGTRIQLDEQGQSLQVAFSQLKSKVETIENISIEGDLSSVIEQVTSNTTNINTMQGQISSLISNTTITKENGEVVQLKDEYNSTKDTVNSHTTKIGSLETNLSTANNNISSVSSKQTALEQNLDGFKQTVSDTYTTKADFNNLTISTRNLLLNTANSVTVVGNGRENQLVTAYRISVPSLLAGKTATLSFKYTVSDWTSDGGIKPQTGSNTWDSFDQVWFSANGTFEYESTITFSDSNVDTELQIRADWLGGTVTILPNTCILTLSDRKVGWMPAPEDIDSRIQTAESKLTKDSLTTTIGDYYTTSSDVDGQITSKGYATTSQLQQTATDLTATFNNGYHQGVTQINAEGIKVYHNEIDGENYTHIAPAGFYIKYKGEDKFSCDAWGMHYKGTITGSTISGSIFKSGADYNPNKLNITGLQMENDTIYSYGTKNNGRYAVTKINGGTINIGNGAGGEGLNWSTHISSSDISLFKQGSTGYFYVGSTETPGSGYSETTSTIDTTTINIGSKDTTTAFKVDYNDHCEFGNNYFTRGTLTINQLSKGAAKGTQTHLTGTSISATNIYQNGSSVSGSDIVLKDNIKEYKDSALDIINKTKVYSFNRILANPDKTEIGFLAQQVPDIFIFDKGEFTAEELEGLTAQEKQQLLDKKTKEYRTVLENKKLDEIANKVTSFYDLNDEQTEEQISQIMDEYKNIEYEVPISTINQNNIIGIMFKAIQELSQKVEGLKKDL